MFRKVLVANRGEIACRIIRTARRLGIATVAVHSTADRRARHVSLADEAVEIGPPGVAQSYISVERLLDAVRESGADAVHPGYGFLSENAEFAAALTRAGVCFIGPPADAIRAMGDKIASKRIARAAGVTTVPGHMGLVGSEDEALRIARQIGYPVMIKASAGGGGKGMRVARNDAQTREGLRLARREAAASFGDDRIFIEKYIDRPRHIEIQILCDSHGGGIHLGERECSIQRRNQKVIEEAPSPFLDPVTRDAMAEQALALARAVGYCSAGTVEFIVDAARNFYFLEMNTRLQVEHPVTELVTGIDLVEQMLRIAAGAPLNLTQADVEMNGWAVEGRLYAEDPFRGFLPSTGRLTRYRPPPDTSGPDAVVRVDSGVTEGADIAIHYDPMIAKISTWARDRAGAISAMTASLDRFEIDGIGHNLPFLSAVMAHPRFVAGDLSTGFVDEAYPDGFAGVTLDEAALRRVAAAAAAMHRVSEIRAARISGRMDNHARRVGRDWVVLAQGRTLPVRVEADRGGATIRFADADDATCRVVSDWRPGARSARFDIDGVAQTLMVRARTGGFQITTGGARLGVRVYSPRQAELARLMPVKARPPGGSDLLRCPMPGLVVSVDVARGDMVEAGQALCTVEAMKMENILRAERRAKVVEITASPGDNLAVDDVIMRFG